jgi:hypothetical protein
LIYYVKKRVFRKEICPYERMNAASDGELGGWFVVLQTGSIQLAKTIGRNNKLMNLLGIMRETHLQRESVRWGFFLQMYEGWNVVHLCDRRGLERHDLFI